MTALERTIYPRFTRSPSTKEVRALYTPSLLLEPLLKSMLVAQHKSLLS